MQRLKKFTEIKRYFTEVKYTTNISIILWMFFIVSLVISSVNSSSFLHSVSEIHYFSFSFLVFLVGNKLAKKNKKPTNLALLIVLTTTLLCIISIWLYVFPEQSKIVWINNLLFPKYGHNHLAEWLLIALPVAWWLAFKKNKPIFYGFPLFFSLMLWFSYGRIAMAIWLLELLTVVGIFGLCKKQQRKVRKIVPIIVLFVGFVVLALFGLVSKNTNPEYCNNFHYSKLFCKTNEPANRTYYWYQAIMLWQEEPVFGTGMGTYRDLSLKHVQTPGFQSDYAHNIVLQMLAESGLVGTVPFVLLFSYLLVVVTINAYIKHNSYSFSLLVAVYASFILALFDFSWSIGPIYYFTIFVIALLLPTLSLKMNLNTQKQLKPIILTNIYLGFSVIMIVFSLVYYLLLIMTGIQLRMYPGRIPNSFIKYFKEFKDEYVELSLTKGEGAREELYGRYPSDRRLLSQLILSAQNDNEVKKYLKTYYELDPLSILVFLDADKYQQLNGLEETVGVVDKVLEYIDQRESEYQYVPRYEAMSKFSQTVLAVADQLFFVGDYEKAAKYYMFVIKFDPWVLGKHSPPFLNTSINVEQSNFFQVFTQSGLSSDFFGNYRAIYANRALELFRLNFDQERYKDAKTMFELALRLSPAHKWPIWNELLEKVISKLTESESKSVVVFLHSVLQENKNDSVRYSSYDLRNQLVRTLQQSVTENSSGTNGSDPVLLISTMKLLLEDDYWVSSQLGNYYVAVGDETNALQEFNQCLNQFDGEHNDCFEGRQSIIDGNPNPERFSQVSQIILGEKRWQDFQ